jgi:dolichol-phosphate mannosyltransferase
LDLVIPLFNEDSVVDILIHRLKSVFSAEALKKHRIAQVRFIMVDDGSTDETPQKITHYIKEGFPAVLCRLSRNFGQQSAIFCGLHQTDADVVAVIDADLQDPPEEIFRMIGKWRTGADVVYAVRRKRKENILKRFCYFLFYRLLHILSERQIPMDSGDFSIMGRNVVHAVCRLPEQLRFERGLRAWVGFRQEKHIYTREARAAGKPKYTFKKLYRLATDGVAYSSIRPLKVAQVFAVLYLFISFVLSILVMADLFIGKIALFNTGDMFILIFIAFSNFAILFCLYIMSAYIGRGYLETKGRPAYIIKEIIDGKADHAR